MSSGRVLLISHGETAANAGRDYIQGFLQTALDAKGRQEAARVARELEPDAPALLLTSDLKRAEQTAQIIGQRLKLRPKPSAAWRPWDTGVLSGCPSEECRGLIKNFALHPEQPVPKGESLHAFGERLLPALQRVLDAAKATGHTVVICTHSRDLSLAMDWLAAGGRKERLQYRNFLADRINPASVLEIRPWQDGYRGSLRDRGARASGRQ